MEPKESSCERHFRNPGLVVQRPIRANPGLNFNLGLFFNSFNQKHFLGQFSLFF